MWDLGILGIAPFRGRSSQTSKAKLALNLALTLILTLKFYRSWLEVEVEATPEVEGSPLARFGGSEGGCDMFLTELGAASRDPCTRSAEWRPLQQMQCTTVGSDPVFCIPSRV